MIRVTDYIADYVVKIWVQDTFLVTGAGMMFLSDGLAINSKLRHYCVHHEQTVAMAAVGYAKLKNNLGVAYVSTGCGGTNAITGLLHAYQDNTPVLFISWQVKISNTTRASWLKLRGYGIQETDIISIVEPLSKYAEIIMNPNDIAYHLEKAVYLAKSGRPGPVWLDIPMDVQSSLIDETKLNHFDPIECQKEVEVFVSENQINDVLDRLLKAKRPVIIWWQGIRLSRSVDIFRTFVEKHKIPVVAPFLGVGILPTDHPNFIWRIGTKWDRPGNFAVQNADFVLVLGSSLCVSAIGYDGDMFAREAEIVVVDIDPVEHQKKWAIIDIFIHGELHNFIDRVSHKNLDFIVSQDWQITCTNWKMKYPVVLPEYKDTKWGINMYYFVDTLGRLSWPNSVVVTDAGSAFYVPTQALPIKEGDRYITSWGQAEMGFTLPGAIWACIANEKKEVIGITGDGSFQFNIQDLQTIVHHHLPVKIFVWNNNGYLSIRASQDRFFEGRYIGTDKDHDVSFPDLEKIAYAYGIQFFRIGSSSEVESGIQKVLDFDGPVICEVMCLPNQEVIPTTSSYKRPDGTLTSRPLEDMYPFLDREEFKANMIIPTVDE